MSSLSQTEEYQRENLALKKQTKERAGKTVRQLYDERNKRTRAAAELTKPDRAPFSLLFDIQTQAGVPNAASYHDPLKMRRAIARLLWTLNPAPVRDVQGLLRWFREYSRC